MRQLTYALATLASCLLSFNIQASSCDAQGDYPNWMGSLYKQHTDVRLRDIAIPGTHDSGAFSIKSIKPVEHVLVTQSRDLCQQAQDGIRYFDLRVRNSDDENQFYIVHNVAKGDELSLVIDPLYEFAKANPKEIIILDFQELNDFEDQGDIQRFNDYFLTKFADRIIPRSFGNNQFNAKNIRFKDAWKMNRNIIVLTQDENVLASSDAYWRRSDNIDSPWANAANIDDLKHFQDQHIKVYQDSDNFYVSQMQMTFLGSGDYKQRFKSLKTMADTANSHLSEWMLSYEMEQGLSPNIIMVDYYERGSNVVETSLLINKHRLKFQPKH